MCINGARCFIKLQEKKQGTRFEFRQMRPEGQIKAFPKFKSSDNCFMATTKHNSNLEQIYTKSID